MSALIDRYINRVLEFAERKPVESENIRREMKDHLLEKIDALHSAGLPREEAILKALHEHGHPAWIGYKMRGGFRWIDVRTQGTARGFIAMGPRAVGFFAFGGVAVGVIACGGVSLGIFGLGGLAAGLLAWGGLAIGGLAFGGMAIGIVAAGGMGIGLVAAGGYAIGVWVPQLKNATSFYSPETVPGILKALEPMLGLSKVMVKHMGSIMAVYILLVGLLSFIQIRVSNRLFRNEKRDWMLED